MGRKRNADSGLKGDEPTCPQEHVLKRIQADGEFGCDQCQSDITQGCCYYGCEPCDFSLCGGCYVKLATNTVEAPALTDEDIDKRIAAEVSELCDHYELEGRVGQQVIEALVRRRETWENDMHGMWMSLRCARRGSVAGLALKKVSMMNSGMYVYVPPPKELDEMCKRYKLDEDATNKLTDLLAKRPDTVENDIIEVEKVLVGSAKPSALVMKMIVAMQQGKEMPKIWARDPPPAPKKEEADASKGGGRKERSRSRVRQRYQGRGNDRDGWYDKDSRNSGDRYRDRDRDHHRSGGGGDWNRDRSDREWDYKRDRY